MPRTNQSQNPYARQNRADPASINLLAKAIAPALSIIPCGSQEFNLRIQTVTRGCAPRDSLLFGAEEILDNDCIPRSSWADPPALRFGHRSFL